MTKLITKSVSLWASRALALCGVMSVFAASTVAAERKHPNIVLIYADDVGIGDLSVYGAELISTPRLDELAEQGVRFTDAHSTASTCTPSRFSLLTGEYAFRTGAFVGNADMPMLIEPGRTTLPSVLQKAGYTTAIVGKWHLGLSDGEQPIDWNGKIAPGPLEVGFDESFIIPATNDRVPTVYVEGHYVYGLSDEDEPLRISYDGPIGDLPTGRSHPELLRYPADRQHSGTIVGDMSRLGHQVGGQSAWWDDEMMAKDLTDRALRFINENQNEPFFLYLSMHENHAPRLPHPDFVGQSITGLRGDAVVELDWVVGQVMDKLDELGLAENTLVIFTSDNGPVFYDGYEDGAIENHHGHRPQGPWRGGKYLPFEGSFRMPTIARWPGQIESGLVSDALLSQVDLVASLAQLVNVELPDGAAPDSQPLLDAWLGKTTEGRDHIIQAPGGRFPAVAIRSGEWKYIEAGERNVWAFNRHNRADTALGSVSLSTGAYLFNLHDDPGEENNLIEAHPDVAQRLTELLEQIRNQ